MADKATAAAVLENRMNSLWAEYAPAYTRVLPNVSFYGDLAQRMVNGAGEERLVLDIGCGPGIISEWLGKKNRAVSMDLDPVMLDYAKGRLLQGAPSSRLLRGNAQELPFENGSFDSVVCNNVLYYVDHPEKVISEAARVLRPGGTFLVSGPRRDYDPRILFEIMTSELKAKGLWDALKHDVDAIVKCNTLIAEKGIKNPFNNEELEVILRSHGFRIRESGPSYHGQCYFIAAAKPGSAGKPSMDDVISQNAVLSGKVEIPIGFKTVKIGGYEFGVAKTRQEMKEIFGLRYRAYSRDNMYESPVPNGLDFDRFDRHAAVFYARDLKTSRLVATVRLIFDSEDGLYMETSYDISKFRKSGVRLAEGSRLAADPLGLSVIKGYETYNISDVVLNRATEFAAFSGVTHILGLSRKKLQNFFTSHGYYPMNGEVTTVAMTDGTINQEQPLYPVVLDTGIAHPIPVREKVPARTLRLPAWDYAVLNPAAGLDAQLD